MWGRVLPCCQSFMKWTPVRESSLFHHCSKSYIDIFFDDQKGNFQFLPISNNPPLDFIFQ